MTKVEQLENDLIQRQVAGLVTIEELEDKIILHPVKYLTPENFQIVREVVEDHYGKYVPKDKGGPFFEVPKRREEKKPKAEEKGNNGTYLCFRCPHCGGSIDATFKPKKES